MFVYPALSPDGRWIARSARGGRLVVRRIDLRRQEAIGSDHVLVQGRADDVLYSMAWSPGGKFLALAGLLDGVAGVWRVHRNGRGLRQVLCGCDARLRWPDTTMTALTWGPGSKLSFIAETEDEAALYSMDASGASLRVLSVFAPGALRDPAWSPDGRQLAVESKLSATRVDTVTVDLTGSGATRTLIPSAWGAAWSPSGKRIAFIRETGVRTMPSGRGRSRPVRITGTFDNVGTTEDLAWVDLARR